MPHLRRPEMDNARYLKLVFEHGDDSMKLSIPTTMPMDDLRIFLSSYFKIDPNQYRIYDGKRMLKGDVLVEYYEFDTETKLTMLPVDLRREFLNPENLRAVERLESRVGHRVAMDSDEVEEILQPNHESRENVTE